MATNSTKKRTIKYLNRDFATLKNAFVEQHLKVYFPDTYNDFNESSVGMMLTEMAAYFGDNISYYLDKKFNESFTETAYEAKNVFKHAKQLGFKAFGKTAAQGVIDTFIKVPAITSSGKIIPDMRYAGKIKKGAKLKSKIGKTYETLIDIDFSTVNINDSRFVQVGERDPQTNQPRNFVLKVPAIDIKAGETTTTTFSVGNYERFAKFTLADDDVLEVLKIIDSEGNRWYEVDFLAQDTVFDSILNTSSDSSNVPYVLKLRSVPYRFISEYDFSTGKTSIVFGSGDAQSFDGDLIPDLGDLALPAFGKDTFTDFTLDPQNFLKTRTLGLAPVNTTLTVTYRVGGGIDTNAGAEEIDTVAEKIFEVSDSALDAATIRDVGNSFSVLNSEVIRGGNEPLDVEEIRQLIPTLFAAQSRLVNPPDFIARSLTLPAKFGSVFRANARLNPVNKNSVELIILSMDANGYVTLATNQLKQNLKTYLNRFRMMTDAIEIMDGDIINLGLDFSVLTNPDFNKNEVLATCIDVLRDFFDTRKFQLNQPINFTDLHVLLSEVPGVISVIDIRFKNLVGNVDGLLYSNKSYNIVQNTRNGILYCQDNAIFEIKYKNRDIRGIAK